MINGFELETATIREADKGKIKILCAVLRNRTQESVAITSDEIIAGFKSLTPSVVLNGSKVRKYINYIRTHALVKNVIATSEGYYVESDPKKINLYVTSLVQRSEAILAVARSFDSTIKVPSKPF